MNSTSLDQCNGPRQPIDSDDQNLSEPTFTYSGNFTGERVWGYLDVPTSEESLPVLDHIEKSKTETTRLRSPRIPAVYYPKVERVAMSSSLASSTQKWVGTVLEIKANSFLARLTDLSQEQLVEEHAEIDISEVVDDDRELVREGAVFYWYLGYLSLVLGQRINASIIRFRRLPVWTEQELEVARQRAAQVQEEIGWIWNGDSQTDSTSTR